MIFDTWWVTRVVNSGEGFASSFLNNFSFSLFLAHQRWGESRQLHHPLPGQTLAHYNFCLWTILFWNCKQISKTRMSRQLSYNEGKHLFFWNCEACVWSGWLICRNILPNTSKRRKRSRQNKLSSHIALTYLHKDSIGSFSKHLSCLYCAWTIKMIEIQLVILAIASISRNMRVSLAQVAESRGDEEKSDSDGENAFPSVKRKHRTFVRHQRKGPKKSPKVCKIRTVGKIKWNHDLLMITTGFQKKKYLSIVLKESFFK